MTEGMSISKGRAISTAVGQVFSGPSNLLIILAIAVVTTTRHFGQIALLLTLLAAAMGVLRGALGAPLLLMTGRSQADIRREGSYAVTSALLVSPVIGCVMWAVAGSAIAWPATLIIIATPIVLVEDVLRHVAVAEGRTRAAALWDGIWFAGSAALLVATWLDPRVATTNHLVGGWAALAVLALAGMVVAVRVGPRLSHYPAWISDGWRHRARSGADSGLEQVALFAVLLFATVVLRPEIGAALVGATTLLAPVAAVAGAILSRAIPNMSPQRAWTSLARIASIATSGTILVGVALFVLPSTAGELLLGPTFEDTQAIIPIVALDYAMAVWIVAVTIHLRAFNRGADAFGLRLNHALVMLVVALGGGLLFHTAAGVAVGMATATTFTTTFALLRFKPWATPPADPAPVEAVAVPDIVRVGAPRPMPLATRLRLHETTPVYEALIMLWSFAALAVFVPAVVIRFTGTPVNATWLWPLPAIAISATRLAWLIGRGERRLFEMMFWVYSYVFLGLTPLAQLRVKEWPPTLPRVDSTFVGPAALMVIIGCGAFLAGAGLDNTTSPQRRWQAARRGSEASVHAFTINYPRTVLLSGFAILLNIYYLAHVGWVQFVMSRYEATAALEAVWPQGSAGVVILPCSSMALLVAFIALLRFRVEARRARAWGEPISPAVRSSSIALMIVVGLLLANMMNPVSSARYLSGTAILAAATAFGLFATRRRFRVVVFGILAGMLIIFPLADAFRVSRQAEFKATNPIESLLSPDYDSFGQLMNGYLVGARDGIVPGKQFSAVLLFWLRRALWPNKPVDTGIYIANVRGYSFTNLSAPLWVEFYLNGGWAVIVVGMFALGFGLHRWDTRLNAQFDVDKMPRLIGCILPFYMVILLRGSLLQAASFLFFIVVFSLYVSIRRPKNEPGAPKAPPDSRPASGVEQPRTNYVAA